MAGKRERIAGKGKGAGYEKLREQRIKENKERMQKLGIWDLSLKLKPRPPPRKIPKTDDKSHDPPPISQPHRRSSRLKTLAPVNYFENRKHKSSDNDEIETEIHIEGGSKPEIYTKEHEMLLGDCQNSWTLLVDGYGDDGKRIYDPVRGETCHQCRQKTLGHHTHCSKCKLVQGQLCGDCLYTRYGEHVIEVNQNPNWICPVCRGICNCSICRQQKGWKPTGAIYRKVKRLGFKSVGHYLIRTYRGQVNTESVVSAEPSADAGSPHTSPNEAIDIDKDREGSPIPLGEECEDGKQEEEKEVHCSDKDNDDDGVDSYGRKEAC
ncbi:hypothetical protein DITRI_Ditri01bG0057500 [Diplodiscus trichospermus]